MNASLIRATALVLVIILFAVTTYCAAKPGLRRYLAFYGWKVVTGKSHGGNYVKSSGVSIYYETFGSGPPVLVLHGGLGSLEDMGCQIKALAASHFVIAPDSRGQGRSADSNQPLSYSLMADDMSALLSTLGISRTDVVGWSDGGIIGLDFAMRYPERVRRLIAISANYDPSGIPQSPTTEVDLPRTPIRYRLQAKDPAYWPVIYRKVIEMWRTQPNFSLDDLGHIRAPTLIIAGEFDLIKREHTAQLAKAIPESREIIVNGATHAVPTDMPDVVNKIILNFLESSPN